MITHRVRGRAGRSRPARTLRELVVAALLGCLVAVAVSAATSCSTAPHRSDDRLDVIVSFYPIQYLAERIGGPSVAVESLVPPGASSHHLELTPRQVGRFGEADVVLYQSGFQAATDDAVKSQQPPGAVDLAAPADIRDRDPHVWLDPTRYQAMAQAVTAAMIAAAPDQAASFRARLDTFSRELTELDRSYHQQLRRCRGATLVTAHTAFGYLADRYQLHQVGIAGIDPEIEPSPARLREVSRTIRIHKVRTLYFEVRTTQRLAETLAEDLRVRTAVLDPIETYPTHGDYLSIMKTNLNNLTSGLTCR